MALNSSPVPDEVGRNGGFFDLGNPGVVITPAEGVEPNPAPGVVWRQVGEPIDQGDSPAPGF